LISTNTDIPEQTPPAHSILPDQQDASLVPWSYETNVRHPIHILLTNGGPDLALDITNFDGWVLNTVAAKLEATMRITRAPRFEKFFDHDGRLIGQRVAAAPQAKDGETVWIGSIHPLATLIDVAKPGERANTRLYERGGTVVAYADADADHPDPATAPAVPGKDKVGLCCRPPIAIAAGRTGFTHHQDNRA